MIGGGAAVAIAAAVLVPRYALYVPGWLTDWRSPIGESRAIVWDAHGPDPLRRRSREDPAGRARSGERPPNIVLIVADDLGWNDISLHGGGPGGGSVQTPNIDAIARTGVRFANGYAAHSTCAPSRAALLSGRYGTRFGFEFTPTPGAMGRIVGRLHDRDPANLHPTWRPDVADAAARLSFADMAMPAAEITLAELLRDRGYHTIHVGKWHLGDAPGTTPLGQGFDESLYMASGKYLPDDDPRVVNAAQDFDPIDRFLRANFRHAVSWNGGPRFAPEGYLTDYFTDQAVAAIVANRERPFFLYLAHWAPHNPLQALKTDYDALGHIADPRARVYAAMIVALDRGIGRVTAALADADLERDTLVMFTSDNGGAGYIGLPEVNQPYRGFKLTFFEGGIRVPLLLRWPGHLPGGATVDAPVHHFDLYATAAAAAGAVLPQDRTIDGVDLGPWARGERTDAPHEALFWRSGHYQAVRAGHWKLQRAARPERTWLFDLAADPTEQHDLAAARPDRVAELTARLDAHNAEQAEPLWPALVELPVMIDKTAADSQSATDEYVYVPN
jgi:arylsulfatase A-like enzyme